MISAHFDAVFARLVADPALAPRMFDSTVPKNDDGTPRQDQYAILYGGGPDVLDSNRFTASQAANSDAEFTYRVRSVSTTPNGVRSVSSHVLTQLAGFVPVITGRACGPMRLTRASEVEEDTNVKPSLWFSDDEYGLTSRRA